MLDSKSLDIISKFKESLLTKSLPTTVSSRVLQSNRGKKLDSIPMTTKVVDYNGVEYLVNSNSELDILTTSNKRKWYETEDQGEYEPEENPQESQDEEEDDENNEEEEENPLDIGLADILSAINHPSDLVCHPSISRTYKSNIVDKLAKELIELIEVEQKTLNSFNQLLQVLNGEDWYYLLEDNLGLPSYDHGLTNDEKQDEIKENVPDDIKPTDELNPDISENGSKSSKPSDEIPKRITRTHDEDDGEVQDPFFKLPATLEKYENANTVSTTQDHELKLELINYLQISTQRQQEYIKNLTELRLNMVRASRLKTTLYKWGKEMYDKKSN